MNLPQIEPAPATTDLHLHVDGGCTSIDEASASTSTGMRSLVPPQIDASPASPLASTSASKETKQTRLCGEEGESNERVVLFFLTPGAPTAAFTCGP